MLKILLFSFLFCLPLLAQTEVYTKALSASTRSEKDRSRDADSKPLETLEFAQVKPGQVIADVFAGGGYFTEILDAVVGPKGKVYMQNNKGWLSFVADDVNLRLADGHLKNTIRHDREAENLDFGKETLDGAFMSMTFHDLYLKNANWSMDADSVIKQIYDSLKPKGYLLLIDHAAKEGTGSSSAQELHRIEEAFTIATIEKAGFKLEKKADFLRNPDDNREVIVFNPSIKGKTDRFVLLFRK